MEFYKQILPVVIDRKEKRSILKSLAKEYTAVVDGADEILKTRFNRVCMCQSSNTWDIFRDEQTGCLLYVMIPEHHKHIEVGCFANNSDDKKVFDNFKSIVRKVLSSFSDVSYVRWKQFNFVNEKFNILNVDSSEKLFTKINPSVITYLKEPFVLNILRAIGHGKTSLMDEISKEFTNVDLFSVISTLVDLGLTSKSFFVYCREFGHQISRMKDLESIRDASSRGLQCPFCGKLFLEEKIDQVLYLTDEGNKFIKNNFWLSLYVGYTLLSIGIYQDNIAVRNEHGLKDTDIFVSYFGKLIYICVKEGPINKEDIFTFAERAEFYNADKTVLITDTIFDQTDIVFFNKAIKNITIINYLGDVQSALKDVLNEVKLMSVSDSIRNFGQMSYINLTSTLTDNFFKDQKENIISKLDPVNIHTSFFGNDLIDNKFEDSKDMIEYEEELIDEVISSNTPFVSEAEEENVSLDSTSLDEEDKSVTDEQEIEFSIDEPIEVEPDLQEYIPEDEESKLSEIDIEEEFDDDDDDFLIQETMRVGFQAEDNIVEIPKMSDYDIKISESSSKVYDNVYNICKSSSIISYSELEDVVSELDENINFSLASKDGFSVFYKKYDRPDAEIVSAYSSEFFDRISKEFSSVSDKNIKSVFINSADSYMTISPVELGYTIFKCEKEVEDIELKIQSSEDVRNSLSDKVFDDLNKIDTVKALLLCDESSANEKQVGNINSVENIKEFVFGFCKENMHMINKIMGDSKISQICIITDSLIYSFVFFEEKTVFVSLIDASAGKEVWYLKIMESAKLIA